MNTPLPQPSPSAIRLLTCLFLTLSLMNCAGDPPPVEIKLEAVSTGCQAFRPITWEKADSKPTVKQVLAHNRAFSKLCPKL